jgi:hypothetical protein
MYFILSLLMCLTFTEINIPIHYISGKQTITILYQNEYIDIVCNKYSETKRQIYLPQIQRMF